ncbi:MAG TPA: hypothetical protein VGE74_04730 [Gemmata sp.]
MRHEQVTPVLVHISRISGGEDITITIQIPADESHGKRKVYVTLKPAEFALALTGRSEQPAEMCVYEFPKAVKK